MIEYFIASVSYPPSEEGPSCLEEAMQTFYSEDMAQTFIDERVKEAGKGCRMQRHVVLSNGTYQVTIMMAFI